MRFLNGARKNLNCLGGKPDHGEIMKTTALTVQLPEDDAQFLEAYAKEHAVSIADLFARYARRLQHAPRSPHPENLKFTGAVPADVDARAEYRQHLAAKHQ